jgi:hypothetical protein
MFNRLFTEDYISISNTDTYLSAPTVQEYDQLPNNDHNLELNPTNLRQEGLLRRIDVYLISINHRYDEY